MGKYSNFERIPRDFYPTPEKGVLPLAPHLPSAFTYAEPCAGDGQLIRHLGAHTGGASICPTDIKPEAKWIDQLDALALEEIHLAGVDLIITNPPWKREILHPMITRFSDLRPTWLLFDADWTYTLQAREFMPRLKKVVSIGRLRWIPGSKDTGKANCAWHLFDRRNNAPTEFYGRMND